MNTSIPDFRTLEERLVQLFQQEQYAEALDLVTRKGPDFAEERARADYWRMCAAARVKNYQLVLSRRAISGRWLVVRRGDVAHDALV